MEKKIKVSVIIPVYNVKNYIEECLNSVINQTLKDIEILCIDDCSPDNSLDIVNKFSKRDKRFRIITHKENLGLGGARNTGIENAEGEYIFFLDADDFIKKEALEVLFNEAKIQNADIVCCNPVFYVEVNGKSKTFGHRENRKYGWNYLKKKNFEVLDRVAWNKLYKRNIFDNKEIRFTNHIIHEDIEFYWKCFLNYPKAYVINKEFYYYRQREGSLMSSNKGDKYFLNHSYILNSIYDYLVKKKLFKKYKHDFRKRLTYFIFLSTQSSKEDFEIMFTDLQIDLKKMVSKIVILPSEMLEK